VRLVLFLRIMAGLSMLKGLYHWSLVLGIGCDKLTPPELVERHGIPFDEVQPVVEAFGRGDIDQALALVPASVGAQLSLAGTPAEWIERIKRDFLPHGYNHIALGLADPFLVERWSGRPADGLPPLHEQLQLLHDHVLPAFN